MNAKFGLFLVLAIILFGSISALRYKGIIQDEPITEHDEVVEELENTVE